MGRSPCCSKVGLRRGPWSTKEDTLLTNHIQQHGEGQWRSLPNKAGLLRCGKSCRLRWMNYLRPGIKRGNISEDEEDLIVRLHGLLGNRWSLIAGRLPGRTDNEIKNYWNTHLLKKLNNAPIQHKDSSNKKSKKKQTQNDEKKKKKKQTENEDDKKLSTVPHEQGNTQIDNLPMIKAYLPKPIRVSSMFSRSSSYDSLVSHETAEKVSYTPVAWSPLFDLEDAVCGGAEEEDFLCGGYILPLLHHDVNMLENVYDGYVQLL